MRRYGDEEGFAGLRFRASVICIKTTSVEDFGWEGDAIACRSVPLSTAESENHRCAVKQLPAGGVLCGGLWLDFKACADGDLLESLCRRVRGSAQCGSSLHG